MNAVEAQVGRVEQRPQRRHDRDVVAHAREVRRSPSAFARFRRERGRRRGRLEADRVEDDLAVRVLAARSAARRAASTPCARRRPRPSRRAACRSQPGTRIMSPKQVKMTSGSCGERDAVVDAAHRDHAHGAARAVDELDVLGQEVVDPVLVDRVGVPAAHLHDLVVAARLDRRQDLAGDGPAELGVAELVDELHAGTVLVEAREGDARVDEHEVAGRDGADELGVHPLPGGPRSARRGRQGAPREARGRVDADDAHADRDVAAGDAVVVGAADRRDGVGGGHRRVPARGHSITLAFSSSSSCSYSAPICSSSASVARASSSSTLREREADVDQYPVARLRRRRPGRRRGGSR